MQLNWTERDYAWGRGACVEVAGQTVELIPFVGSDGSGEVVSFSLFVGALLACRIAGELPAVQAEAEKVVKRRFGHLFQESAA